MTFQQTKKRLRTCIGCGIGQQKIQLYRLVRTAEGTVVFDPTGRQPGRGAYVCSGACLTDANKNKKLERALRCKVSEEDYERAHREIDREEASTRNKE